MLYHFLMLLIVILAAWRVQANVRNGSVLWVLWLGCTVYAVVLWTSGETLRSSERDGAAIAFEVGRDLKIDSAVLIFYCLLGLLIPDLLLQKALNHLDRRVSRAPYRGSEYISWLWTLAFPAIYLGGGGSYEEYVSGDSIGWGVTCLLLASCSIPDLLQRPSGMATRIARIALVLLAGGSLAASTGVRYLLLFPVIGVMIGLASINRDRIRNVTIETRKISKYAGISALVGLGIIFFAITDSRFNTGDNAAGFERHLARIYFGALATELESTGSLGPQGWVRAVRGLTSYPEQKLFGYTQSGYEDAAVELSRISQGDYRAVYAHYPATIFLDARLTGTQIAGVETFLLGSFFCICAFFCARLQYVGRAIGVLVGTQMFMTTRGAVYNGATGISAALTLLLLVVLIEYISNLMRTTERKY